ncbi:MAG: LacI family DNA-binding transcriptional regulator [Kiritimatiellales bacterium]
MNKTVKMADIAREAGVSIAAVSLALNNHARVSAETKKRILRICEKRGYQINSAARALAGYRNPAENNQPVYIGTLALLESEQLAKIIRPSSDTQNERRQFTEACRRMGYRMDHFVVGETAPAQRALGRTLLSRGIHGLLIYGFHSDLHTWGIGWENFAAVAYASSVTERFIHNVMSSSYQDVFSAMLTLRERGYLRPGYVMNLPFFQPWAAGYAYAVDNVKFQQIPKLIMDGTLERSQWKKKFLNWFKKYTPDVIVSGCNKLIPEIFAEENIRMPDDVGYLSVDSWDSVRHLSGLHQLREEAYRILVDILHGMLRRNELGPPAQPYCIQIPSVWNEGTTLIREN